MGAVHTTRRWGRAAVAQESRTLLLRLAAAASGRGVRRRRSQATASASQAGVPVVVSWNQVSTIEADDRTARRCAWSAWLPRPQPVAYAQPVACTAPRAVVNPIATPVVARTTTPRQVVRGG